MTYFVANGPDIPEHLLQEHEDGNVVFFVEQEYLSLLACRILKD